MNCAAYHKLKILPKKIGEGSYAKVYETSDPQSVCKEHVIAPGQGLSLDLVREMASLQLLQNCPQICKLQYYGFSDNRLHAVMQKYKTNLAEYLATYKPSLTEIKKIMFQLLLALKYAESKDIVHRDLKPFNIFLDDADHVVLGDWGLSRNLRVSSNACLSGTVQSVCFRAPELMLGAKCYGYEIEVWSLGCILYELFEESMLFPGRCEVEVLRNIFRKMGTPFHIPELAQLPHFQASFPDFPVTKIQLKDAQAEDLVNAMLSLNPKTRPSFEACLSHAFFQGIGDMPLVRILPKPRVELFPGYQQHDRNAIQDWMFRIIYQTHLFRILPINGEVLYVYEDFHNSKRTTDKERKIYLEVYFLGCAYFTSFLDSTRKLITSVLDYALACLALATKMIDSQGPNVEEIRKAATMKMFEEHKTSLSKLIACELEVAHALSFHLHRTTLFDAVRKIQAQKHLKACELSASLVYLSMSVPQVANSPNFAQHIVDFCSGAEHDSSKLQDLLLSREFDNGTIKQALFVLGVLPEPVVVQFGTLELLPWHFAVGLATLHTSIDTQMSL
jgi:serine/threonine protein kinase